MTTHSVTNNIASNTGRRPILGSKGVMLDENGASINAYLYCLAKSSGLLAGLMAGFLAGLLAGQAAFEANSRLILSCV